MSADHVNQTATTSNDNLPTEQQENHDNSHEFPTFSELFVELTHFLGRVPIANRPLLHDKALLVIQNKFTALLQKEDVIIDDVTRDIVQTVSNILAICLEDVLLEVRDGSPASCEDNAGQDNSAEMGQKMSDVYEVMSTAGSDYLIQNVKHRREELKGLLDWMGDAMTTADEWGAWIQETVASAEEKVHKQKGEIVNEDGQVAKLTSSEWNQWREELKRAARGMMDRKRGIVEAAERLGGGSRAAEPAHVEPPSGDAA